MMRRDSQERLSVPDSILKVDKERYGNHAELVRRVAVNHVIRMDARFES
jgi:hypothetical protein